MKNIFNYPDDASTQYIDPDYIGDDTEGFQKRINELKDGTYKTWSGRTVSTSVNAIMAGCSKYHDAFAETWGQNTIFKFWENPMVEFTMRVDSAITVQDVTDVAIEVHRYTDLSVDFDIPKLKVTFSSAHGFTEGQRIYLFSADYPILDEIGPTYAEVIDTTNIYLRNNSNSSNQDSTYEFAALNDSVWDNRNVGGGNASGRSRSIRYDGSGSQGSMIKFDSIPSMFQNGREIQLVSSLTNPSDTGTLNSESTKFEINALTGTTFSWLPTISGSSTPATLNEHYYDTPTKTFTGAGVVGLQAQLFSDWGIPSASNYVNDGNGWCRIIATVNSGTFEGSYYSDEDIPTSISYSQEFYWSEYYDGGTGQYKFNIYNKRGTGSVIQDFVLSGSSPSVDIEIKFINPANTDRGWVLATDESMSNTVVSDNANLTFEVDTATVILPGGKKFEYQDTSNITQGGAKYGEMWIAGDTTATALGAGESFPPSSTITLNGSNYLTGFDFTDGRGSFANNTTRLITILDADDTYVAPTVSTAAAQDNFNLSTIDWATSVSGDGEKYWPTTVKPSEATISHTTPTLSTVSRSGVKFSKTSGFTRTVLSLNYPPMTQSEFKTFQSRYLLAQGGAGKFKLNIQLLDDFTLGFFKHTEMNAPAYASTKTPRVLKVMDDDGAIMLEGFPSGYTGQIYEGQIIWLPDAKNGGTQISLADCDANQYGEAKLLTLYNDYKNALEPGDLLDFDDDYLIVSLSGDSFEYQQLTSGHILLSVDFELDHWR